MTVVFEKWSEIEHICSLWNKSIGSFIILYCKLMSMRTLQKKIMCWRKFELFICFIGIREFSWSFMIGLYQIVIELFGMEFCLVLYILFFALRPIWDNFHILFFFHWLLLSYECFIKEIWDQTHNWSIKMRDMIRN